MVEKWKKELEKAARNFGKKDLEKIVIDIINKEYSWYDVKPLIWFENVFRIRVWNYRIIFKAEQSRENKILLFWKRGDVYKALKDVKK